MIKIDQALISAFVSADFGLPIAHENSAYSPSSAYAEIEVFQNDVSGLGLTDTNETSGFFQVILRYPENTGAVAIKTKADQIFSVFKIGAVFQYDGVRVKITRNRRNNGVNEEGWYKTVVTIGYKAFLSR